MLVDGKPISAALFDFGLYFFHNARRAHAPGTGPYFYLPKLESHLEARLWNDVFIQAEDTLGLPQGTIKGTVLIETILAAFEMDEILYELREHSAGLNCGRWDYIFSVHQEVRHGPTSSCPTARRYDDHATSCAPTRSWLIKTCHRRGAHAMGGMAAQIPIKNDPAGERGRPSPRCAPTRSARRPTATTAPGSPTRAWCRSRSRFSTELMPGPNQIDRKRDDVNVTAADLLDVRRQARSPRPACAPTSTSASSTWASWLAGNGCVPIYNLMEDAATAEISRAQVWQWVHSPRRVLADGRKVDLPLVTRSSPRSSRRSAPSATMTPPATTPALPGCSPGWLSRSSSRTS